MRPPHLDPPFPFPISISPVRDPLASAPTGTSKPCLFSHCQCFCCSLALALTLALILLLIHARVAQRGGREDGGAAQVYE